MNSHMSKTSTYHSPGPSASSKLSTTCHSTEATRAPNSGAHGCEIRIDLSAWRMLRCPTAKVSGRGPSCNMEEKTLDVQIQIYPNRSYLINYALCFLWAWLFRDPLSHVLLRPNLQSTRPFAAAPIQLHQGLYQGQFHHHWWPWIKHLPAKIKRSKLYTAFWMLKISFMTQLHSLTLSLCWLYILLACPLALLRSCPLASPMTTPRHRACCSVEAHCELLLEFQPQNTHRWNWNHEKAQIQKIHRKNSNKDRLKNTQKKQKIHKDTHNF